jgi:hypothetical protein
MVVSEWSAGCLWVAMAGMWRARSVEVGDDVGCDFGRD